MPIVEIPSIEGAHPVSLHYNIVGNGPRKIFFVMGLSATLDGWTYQQIYFGEENAQDYTICVYDNRGVGKSSAPSIFNSVPIMANDGLALLDHLGWEQDVHLVGISMGGMISMQMASQQPNRFATLTLVNTHAGEWRPLGLKALSLFVTSFASQDKEVRLKSLMKLLFSHQLDLNSPKGKLIAEALKIRFNKNNRPSHIGFFSQLQSVLKHKMSANQLSNIKASGLPILIIVGADDILVRPDRGYELHAALGGELKIFKGIGHALVSEAFDGFNTALETHIRRHDPIFTNGVRPIARVPNFDPLSPVDRLFVVMESPENSMAISGLSFYAPNDAPTITELFASFNKWVAMFPRLRQKIHTNKETGDLEWVFDHDFDLNQHIRAETVTSRRSVQDIVANEVSRPLKSGMPLWNAVLIQNAPLGTLATDEANSVGTGLFIQLHHAIADGGLSVHMMLALCKPLEELENGNGNGSSNGNGHGHGHEQKHEHEQKQQQQQQQQQHHVKHHQSKPDPNLVLEDSNVTESGAQEVVEPKMAHHKKSKLPSVFGSLFLLAASAFHLILYVAFWLKTSVLAGVKMMGVNMLGATPFERVQQDKSKKGRAGYSESLKTIGKSISETVEESKKTVTKTVDWIRNGENVWSLGGVLRGRSGINLLKQATKHFHVLDSLSSLAKSSSSSSSTSNRQQQQQQHHHHHQSNVDLLNELDNNDSILFPDQTKFVAWTDPLDLVLVKKIGKALNASVNDILLSCASGAFSRAFAAIDENAVPLEVPVMVPFNMRARLASPFSTSTKNVPDMKPSKSLKMGNESTMLWLSLPSSSQLTPAQRVEAVKQRMNTLKHSAEPVLAWITVFLVGLLPNFITKWLTVFYGNKAAAVITNVPGPTMQLTLAGHKMLSYTGFIPTPGLNGIGLTIFSYNGKVGVSMTGNCRLKPSVKVLAEAFAAEFEELKSVL